MTTVDLYNIWVDTSTPEDEELNCVKKQIHLCETCLDNGFADGMFEDYDHVMHTPAEPCEICEQLEEEINE